MCTVKLTLASVTESTLVKTISVLKYLPNDIGHGGLIGFVAKCYELLCCPRQQQTNQKSAVRFKTS